MDAGGRARRAERHADEGAGGGAVAAPLPGRRAAPAPAEPVARGPMTLRAAARRLLGYLRPHRGTLAVAFACFVGAASLEPILPAMLKYLFDHGFTAARSFPLWAVPLAVVGLFLVRGALNFAGTYLFAWATSRSVLALRHDLVRAMMRADASLYTTLSPGVATARVINEPQNAVNALTQGLTTLVRDGVSLLVLLAYLFWLNWRLTLIVMVIVPLLVAVIRQVQRRVIAVGARTFESQVRLTGIIDDIARAWRVVRTFDAAEFEQRRFGDEAARLRSRVVKGAAAGAMVSPLTQLIASLGVATILTIALWQAGRDGTTAGAFVAFLAALLMTTAPLRRLTDVMQPIVTGLIQARACFELVDAPPEPDPGTRELGRARGELALDRLTVAYPGAERPALERVSLAIGAGETVALVGPSGAGKSTLVSTLLGFVAPTEGGIRLDGIDLGVLTKASLRRQFAVVSQDIVLFDGPLEANVVYAQPYDAARVEACLRAAQLWDFARTLPDGPRTPIGTNGSRLSGGQRQRLAIARALYKDAPVWIFDEATSALDSESERAVHEAIAAGRGERTLILIAHRLSTVRHADRIHVLDDGRLVESGRHEELLAADGRYAAMVRAQAIH